MLKIGMFGPDYLLRRNEELFQQQQIKATPIRNEQQLAQIDGLLITGWKTSDYLRQLKRFHTTLQQVLPQISLLGIAAGAVCFGRSGFCPVMDCDITLQPGHHLTTAILEIPGFSEDRFTACFLPELRFRNLAPNLGILCQDQKRGPIVVRQGNHLACSYVAEITPQPYLYRYWLEMVAALKNSRKN